MYVGFSSGVRIQNQGTILTYTGLLVVGGADLRLLYHSNILMQH